MTKVRFMIFSALFALATVAAGKPVLAAQEVILYSYYLEAPYITGEKRGLNHDLAQYLNEKADGRYRFTVKILPRKRVDRLIERGAPMVVPWAAPEWFKDLKTESITWSKPYLQGAAVVVTNQNDPLVYKNPASVKPRTVQGVVGYHYPGVDDLVNRGLLRRHDLESYDHVFKLLAARAGHCTVVSQLTARYLIKELGLEGKVRLAEGYHSTFKRHFLIVNHSDEMTAFLDATIDEMAVDDAWRRLMRNYGLEELIHHDKAHGALRPAKIAQRF